MMLFMTKLVVVALGLLASCGSTPAPGELKVSEVKCWLPKGETFLEASGDPSKDAPFKEDVAGPVACRRSLELFLRTIPDDRVVSVVAVVRPAVDGALGRKMLNSNLLLVVHSDKSGPWPRARDLKVEVAACYPNAGLGCADALATADKASEGSVMRMAASLEDLDLDAGGTSHVLILSER